MTDEVAQKLQNGLEDDVSNTMQGSREEQERSFHMQVEEEEESDANCQNSTLNENQVKKRKYNRKN